MIGEMKPVWPCMEIDATLYIEHRCVSTQHNLNRNTESSGAGRATYVATVRSKTNG